MAQRTWGVSGAMSTDYATAGNWFEGSVPVAADEVTIGPTTTAILTNLNQSAVSLDEFTVQEGAAAIGTAYVNLQIATSLFHFNGTDTAYIDIGASAISPRIFQTATPATGYRGLFLIGSAMATCDIEGGYVGLAYRRNETSSATTVRVGASATSVWTGPGLTNTTWTQYGGTNIIQHAATNLNIAGGYLYTRGSGAYTTVNVYSGTFYPCSTGTITTLNIWAGATVDFRQCGLARTVTTLNMDPHANVKYDPAVLTITNAPVMTGPISIKTSGAYDAGSWIYQRGETF